MVRVVSSDPGRDSSAGSRAYPDQLSAIIRLAGVRKADYYVQPERDARSFARLLYNPDFFAITRSGGSHPATGRFHVVLRWMEVSAVQKWLHQMLEPT
jgi:hypothetical protein